MNLSLLANIRFAVPIIGLAIFLSACSSSGGSVTNKVLQDFGIRDRPEGHRSGEDKVLERLDGVGVTELKRLNAKGRRGVVKFEETGELRGKFYKQVKVYERHYPLDVDATGQTRSRAKGYVGRIEYSYRMYESARKSTRAEAAALSAEIPTTQRKTEVYRYHFSFNGVWDGQEGENATR